MELEKTINQNNFTQQQIQTNVEPNQTQQFNYTNNNNNFHFYNNSRVRTLPRNLTNVSEDYLNAYFGMTAN